MGGVTMDLRIDAGDLTTREINDRIRAALRDGAAGIAVSNPAGRHNLAVALEGEATITFEGTVGYFVGALGMGPRIVVNGNAGWSVGADIMGGGVHVHGNAGSSVGASIRGGLIVVDGDVGARAGIALKGGKVVIGGNAGYMTGFMMQTGTLVIGGDAAEGLGDSIYTGDIFVGGEIASLGADAVVRDPTDDELAKLKDLLCGVGHDPDRSWKHVTSAGNLWHFEKEKYELWKEAF
ncbi:MAG: glutamate synthase [Actinobacteria bacterium]|nr:glutamate synthase [Actinomycetota bacterium]